MEALLSARQRLQKAVARLELVQKRHLADVEAMAREMSAAQASALASAGGPDWAETVKALEAAQADNIALMETNDRVAERLDAVIARLDAIGAPPAAGGEAA